MFTQQSGYSTHWRVYVTLLFSVTALFLSHHNTFSLLHLFTSHRQCSDYTAKFLTSHLVLFTLHNVQGILRYLNVTYLHHAFLCTLRTTILCLYHIILCTRHAIICTCNVLYVASRYVYVTLHCRCHAARFYDTPSQHITP